MAFYRIGDDARAVEDCTAALNIDPKSIRALGRRARSYERLAEACSPSTAATSAPQPLARRRSTTGVLAAFGERTNALEGGGRSTTRADLYELALVDFAALHQLQSVGAVEAERSRKIALASQFDVKMRETQVKIEAIAARAAAAAAKVLFLSRVKDRARFDRMEDGASCALLPSDSYMTSFYHSFTEGLKDPFLTAEGQGVLPENTIEAVDAALATVGVDDSGRAAEAELRLHRARLLRRARRYKEMVAEFDRLCLPPPCGERGHCATGLDAACVPNGGGGDNVPLPAPELPDLSTSLFRALPGHALQGAALSEWATALVFIGDLYLARKALTEALQLHPTIITAIKAASVALELDDLDLCDALFARAETLPGAAENADLCYHRGLARFVREKRVGPALADLKRATELAPTFAMARLQLGTSLFRAREYRNSLAELKHACALAPNLPDTHNYLGEVLAAQGRVEEAGEAFEAAIAVDPGYALAYVNQALLLWQRAGALVMNAGKERTPSGGGATVQSVACREGDMLTQAKAKMLRAIEVDPTCDCAYYNLSSWCMNRGEYSEAARHCDVAIEHACTETELAEYMSLRMMAVAYRDASAMLSRK